MIFMSLYVRFGILGFLIGVASRSFFDWGISFVVFALLLSVFLLAKRTTAKTIFFVATIFFVFGYVRTGFISSRSDAFLEKFVDQKITAVGIVRREPDVRENSTRLVVGVEKYDIGKTEYILPSEEKVLLVVRKYPEFSYGDRVKMEGRLILPENFQNEDGRSFDYISYLKKDGILYEISFPKMTVLERGKGNAVVAFLYNLKSVMTDEISQILPEPHAGLLGGLLFGAKRSIDAGVLETFRIAGIIHIVVLSGYNITIVADFITRFFLMFPISRISASLLGGTGVILFAIMTGLGASTLRAVLMALLAIFARVTGRTSDALHLLLVTAFFMVLWNPLSLLYDPSFQLSFSATLGLLWLGPELTRRFTFVSPKWGLRETLSATLSTQVFVLPLLLYKTGMFSIVAIPVNLIVLPLIPIAMFFGALGMTLGFITPFGTFFGFPVFLVLSFVFAISSFFAELPFSCIKIQQFSSLILIVVYSLYIIVYFVYQKNENNRQKTNEKIQIP
jgi:competence protein ComEC